jgi:fucokinase
LAYWDYLILSASNKRQADSYKSQIDLRLDLDRIRGFRNILIVPDPEGKRVGSAGSTVQCLMKVIEKERGLSGDALKDLRILIIHAGGDSKRLPPYSTCGKIFMPLPGKKESLIGTTIFDRVLSVYKDLPEPDSKKGQITVTSGDVILDLDPEKAFFYGKGITGLGCLAVPETTKNHGVFCPAEDGEKVRRFLQKPSVAKQKTQSALDRSGKSILDIGIINIDTGFTKKLFDLFGVQADSKGNMDWSGPLAREVMEQGMDLYREIACALGTEVDFSSYYKEIREAGSTLPKEYLKSIFDALSGTPFYVHVVPECGFYHFGDLKHIIESTLEAMDAYSGLEDTDNKVISINMLGAKNFVSGKESWLEGCRIKAKLTLGGRNIVVGVDVNEEMELPENACLDIIPGKNRSGKKVFFVRLYSCEDDFKTSDLKRITVCGLPLGEWLKDMEAGIKDIWDDEDEEKTLWNAHLFPAVEKKEKYKDFLWMYDLKKATAEQKRAWVDAKRFSFRDMSLLSDPEAFQKRRLHIRMDRMYGSLEELFAAGSDFSAKELSYIIDNKGNIEILEWISGILNKAYDFYSGKRGEESLEKLHVSRIFHALGSAVLMAREKKKISDSLKKALSGLNARKREWLDFIGLSVDPSEHIKDWAERAKKSAFINLRNTIVLGKGVPDDYPKNSLRSDEIIWARAPARLDLGGGWTDTPPYSLEKGGCVINAAVNLNGQPPIHVYARVSEKPYIKINSIDHGESVKIEFLEDLLDYKTPSSKFGLAKAALVLCGFSPEKSYWPGRIHNLQNMLDFFGGGIELTTLAAIPSGSGLGTSSIMGAALVSAIYRMTGKNVTRRELFYRVLQLEQELTTGGGWQDQIGGSIQGVKMITTKPGLMPDPKIQSIRPDVMDPDKNGGQTLLFYTGIRRLAKNILQDIVGNYLDRDHRTVETLHHIHRFPSYLSKVFLTNDIEKFGEALSRGWELKKEIDPESTNEQIDKMIRIFKPYLLGATMLGAGGGGFILFVCKSLRDALLCREELKKNPPNERARFFDFSINHEGLVVTTC